MMARLLTQMLRLVNILPNGNLLVVYPNPVKDQLFFITHKDVNAAASTNQQCKWKDCVCSAI